MEYDNFICLDSHPLVRHKLTLLRDKTTPSKDFREITEEVTLLVASEALKNLTYNKKVIYTPITTYEGIKINKVTLIPVIRAGLVMMAPLQKLLPDSKVGFMGASRDETTFKAHQYYSNIPKFNKGETALILDPMLATGNTVVHTLDYLKNNNYNMDNIIIISILATPNALDNIFKKYEHCLVYAAGFDTELNSSGYIVPGLGDAGDRIFNT